MHVCAHERACVMRVCVCVGGCKCVCLCVKVCVCAAIMIISDWYFWLEGYAHTSVKSRGPTSTCSTLPLKTQNKQNKPPCHLLFLLCLSKFGWRATENTKQTKQTTMPPAEHAV